MTLVLDNLARRNLVERRRDTADRRCISIHLTSEGRALIERILPHHVRVVVEAVGVLSQEEQATLGNLARKLGRGYKDNGLKHRDESRGIEAPSSERWRQGRF